VSSFRMIKKETVFTTLIDFISHKVNNTSYSKIHSICNHQKRKIPDRQKHQLNNFSTNTLGLKINTQILYKKSMSSLITKTMWLNYSDVSMFNIRFLQILHSRMISITFSFSVMLKEVLNSRWYYAMMLHGIMKLTLGTNCNYL